MSVQIKRLYLLMLLTAAWMVALDPRLSQELAQERRRDERGEGAPAWVVLVGIGVTGAIAIGGIVIAKFKGAADGIPTK